MASVTNAFSLLDDGHAGAGATGKSKSKRRNKGKKDQEKSGADSAAQPTPSQPELFTGEDLHDGFQAVAAKGGKSRAADSRGAVALSAVEAAERAVSAAGTAEDMISLLRGWMQQVRRKHNSGLRTKVDRAGSCLTRVACAQLKDTSAGKGTQYRGRRWQRAELQTGDPSAAWLCFLQAS